MHIPGGLVSDAVCALTTVTSSSALGVGFWHARRGGDHSNGRSLAAVGALVFAVQMVNFPVDHGTSGHLIGGALAAALLGPWGAMWAMASVVTIQALLFGDGGCGALGANLLTMAVAAPWTAWLAYRGLDRVGLMGRKASGGANRSARDAAAWGLAALASVLAAATLCSLILAWGGAAPTQVVVPAMLLAHLPVGLVEAVATAAVVLLAAGRIALPLDGRSPVAVGRVSNSAMLLAALAVAVLLAPLASSAPDGLATVATRLGFAPAAAGGFAGLLPDYVLPGVRWAPVAVALAGLVGVAAVSVTGYLVGRAAVSVSKSR
ncbi:MAG TPA: energy-coupling factor ABC transporter permease [Pirellulales bacterium]|jgi:cobalt/nickel transport system permease protein